MVGAAEYLHKTGVSKRQMQVKASGGVRDLDTLLAMLPFVTRCGTSRTREILDAWRSRLGLAPIAS